MNESEVKAEWNGTKAFGMPLFGFPKIALPGVFAELAEQGVARAQEGCDKLKTTSEEIAEALRYNLCRCGAHVEILRAAKRAAGLLVEAND